MAKRTLAVIASILLLVSSCICRPKTDQKLSEAQKLRELGVYSEEDYSRMPVEKQIEILVEMEPYFAAPSPTRSTMVIAISQKGEEAVEPVIAAINRLQTERLLQPPLNGVAMGDLARSLGLIHLYGRADLRDTEAEALLQIIACRESDTWATVHARDALYMIRYDENPPRDYQKLRDILCGP